MTCRSTCTATCRGSSPRVRRRRPAVAGLVAPLSEGCNRRRQPPVSQLELPFRPPPLQRPPTSSSAAAAAARPRSACRCPGAGSRTATAAPPAAAGLGARPPLSSSRFPAPLTPAPAPALCPALPSTRPQMQRAYQQYNDAARGSGKTRGHFVVDLSRPGHLTSCLRQFQERIGASDDNWDAMFGAGLGLGQLAGWLAARLAGWAWRFSNRVACSEWQRRQQAAPHRCPRLLPLTHTLCAARRRAVAHRRHGGLRAVVRGEPPGGRVDGRAQRGGRRHAGAHPRGWV